MEVAFTLHLPRDAMSVPVVRQLCRSTFKSLGIEDDCVHDLELDITEACTNVLKHATDTGEAYEVEVWTSGSTCDIRVRDRGQGFDPARYGSSRDARATAEGGRGIELMRVLVDSLSFSSEGDSGTMVHLEKSLALRQDSPLKVIGSFAPKAARA